MTLLIGSKDLWWYWSEVGGGGGGRSLELMFTRSVPLASQSPYSIIVYFWPIIEPILVTFWKCNFRDSNFTFTFYLCTYLINVVSSGAT